EARNAVLTTVVADVARAYFDMLALRLRLEVARNNLRIQQQSLELAEGLFTQGITNELDVAIARRELATTQSTIAPFQAALAQAQRRLTVLLGRTPQRLYGELQLPRALPDPPARVRPGLPVDLLRRRPDIREAERQLAASTARIGVATADLFPRVALTGAYGFQGQGLGRTPDSAKMIWSLGPTAYWPLLDFGTLDSIVEVQDLRTQELLYNYRRSILLAVEEVDNAISNYNAQRDSLDQLNSAIIASQRAVTLATEQYRTGLTPYLDVVDAQRQLYALQDEQAVAQESVIVQYVALYKALGGGWEPFQSVPPIRNPRPAVIAAGAAALQPNPSTNH
ncbi:MAG TPA: efflux transporter outer membrane subunit, partial [Gemmataceae bacterium]|nr:efflux transporter outer membrane subunit [Gemmataceae bacterium]